MPAELKTNSSPGVGGKRLTGKVRWFNNAKGYGFIVRDDGLPDVFIHYTNISSTANYRYLNAWDEVTFELYVKPDGRLTALDVKVVRYDR